MRVLYVTQTFYPEPLSTERFVRQAAALQRLGHDVTILTSMPFYPVGRIFPGYRWRLFKRETHAGLSIVRVWSVPAANSGMLRRMASFLSFAILATIVALLLRRSDLVIAAVPNPGTEFVGIVVSRCKGSTLLLEMVDLVPENLTFLGVAPQSRLYRTLERYYKWAYRAADVIGVLCSSASDVLVKKGIDPSKIILMPNASDLDLLDSIAPEQIRDRHGFAGAFVVVYAGSFSGYYRVGNIIRAAALLRDSHPHIRFALLGHGSDWNAVRSDIERLNLSNVTLTGVVPRAELGGYLQAANLFLMSMVAEATPHPYHGILTAKACDYLLVGRPILAIEQGDILGRLLERIGAGVHVPPDNPPALVQAILAFAQDPGRCRNSSTQAAEYGRAHLLRDDVVARVEREVLARMRPRHAGQDAHTGRTAPSN